MSTTSSSPPIAFIGGGNMAGAIIGGLLRGGQREATSLLVVDPGADQRATLESAFGVRTLAVAGPELAEAATTVWAVKPQVFGAAAAACAPFVGRSLQLSVMAGIRSASVAAATGAARVVRAMPNTPALIGRGITGLYANPAVRAAERDEVEAILGPTGQRVWVEREADLDAVTALSGSGPAYVFFILEAMIQAACDMGLTAAQGRALAIATFAGATQLADDTPEPPELLRQRVTSKGGTTFAALSILEARGVKPALLEAIRAAQRRAAELGDEFGALADSQPTPIPPDLS